MKKFLLLAIGSALLGACSTTPALVNLPETGVLGTLEMQFGSQSDPIFQSAKNLQTRTLTPKPDSSISASFVSFVTLDSGSVRTLTAVYDITNNTASTFQNLSLVAYAKTGNSNSSALKSINAFSGAPSSTNVYDVKPAQGTDGSVDVSEFNSDLQVYTSTEATNFTTAAQTAGIMTASEYALEYGFVARQSSSSHLRSITAGATARVSLSMKIPVSADVTSGTRFTMTFVVADNDAAHVVQSLEEPLDGANAIARAAAVGAGTEVRYFANSTTTASPGLMLNPRTAGTTAVPLAIMYGTILRYELLNINAAIPDGSGDSSFIFGTAVSRSFTIPAIITGTIAKATLRAKVTHTWRSDVRVRLTSPSATTLILYGLPESSAGASSGDNINLTLDDASSNTVFGLCANATNNSCVGTAQPVNALSAINGTVAAGDWIVQVDDALSLDTGTLNELELSVTVTP